MLLSARNFGRPGEFRNKVFQNLRAEGPRNLPQKLLRLPATRQQVNRAVSRAEGVTEAARDAIRGTELDKGVVLDELRAARLAN